MVLLLQDLAFGGTQRQSLELARGLDPERFEVELWMLMHGDDLEPEARRWGLRTRWLGRGGWVSPGTMLRLRRELGRHEVDILVLLTVVPNIWGRLLGRLRPGLKLVATCRGGGSIKRQHERLLWRLSHTMICNTKELEGRLKEIYGVRRNRVFRIVNGVDSERFQPPADGQPRNLEAVLCLARLVPDKGHDTLLKAFAQLLNTRPRARLWLAGDGPLRPELEAMAGAMGMADRVDFLGSVDDPLPLLREAGVMALASRQEAMPNAVLEAMASSLPVVATRVGGLPELLEDTGAGLLAAPGDAEALAGAMEHLLGHPEQAEAMGRAGRAAVEAEYSLEVMVRRHTELFERLAR